MRGCADSIVISMDGCFTEIAGMWVYVVMLLMAVVVDAAALYKLFCCSS
jgi:hypothetical protein